MVEQQPQPKQRIIKVEQKSSPPPANPYALLERQYNDLREEMEILKSQMAVLQQTWNSLLTVANRAVIIQQLQSLPINPIAPEPPELKPELPPEPKLTKSIPHWEREKGITDKAEEKPKKKSSKKGWLLFGILVLLIIGLIYMFYLYNNDYVFFWQAQS